MSSVREFAARIAMLERGLSAISTSPQLGHSSLDGENVNVYDVDGNLKATVGAQHDGTYTSAELDGPIPPVPGVPSVEGGPGNLTVAWGGGYEDDARAPLDFRLVEIYAAPEAFTDRADAILLGHFSNEAGGELSMARPVGEWHVGLVTKAESGRRSAVSMLAVGVVTSMVDQAIFDDLENRLDGLGDDLGDLITTIIPGLKDTINEITGVTLPALDVELGQAKSDIIDAFGAASDAATDASNAQDTADAAAQSAAEAVGMISGMGTVLFQDEQPDAEHENDSTLWIDTTDGANVSKRWDGTQWKIVRDPAIVDAVDKAIAAKQAADEAKQAADAADLKADQAVTDAGNAQGTADQAVIDAASAEQAASSAEQAALDAAGIAEGKGDVLIQSGAPAAEYRAATSLWIDTTGGENTPKRWSGSTWLPVTDKAATDAADAAQAAQSKANQAESDASDAQNRADAAHTLAGTAEDNAQAAIQSASSAQTSADHVAKNLFSTSNPSGTAPYGSIWFKVNSTGEVVGQWQQGHAGIAGGWVQRQVRSEVIANLDVGKLTAGTAAIGNLVAEKIAVSVATIIELNADRIKAGTIDVERLNAEAIAAAVGTFLELRADQITASGAGFDVAVINQLFADMFVAHKITAEHADLRSFVADEGFVLDMRTNILTASSVPPDALKIGMNELLPDPMFERQLQTPTNPFAYSTLHRESGQERTLQVKGAGLNAASRFWLSDSKAATPRERYILRMEVRTTTHDYAIAMGLEVQDKNGVRIGDLIVPGREAAEEQQEPGAPGDQGDPEDPEEDPEIVAEYPLNEYFPVDGIVRVPDSGFRVRPWIGLIPTDTAVSGQDWHVSQVSWRGVPSTTSAEGWVTTITPNGLQVTTPAGQDAVKLGNYGDIGMTLYQTGPRLDDEGEPILDDEGQEVITENPTVAITDDGYVGANEMSVDESFTYRGDELQDLLDENEYDGPRGIVSHNVYSTDGSYRGPYSQETGVFYGRFVAEPDRLYKVSVAVNIAGGDSKFVRLRLRRTRSTTSWPSPSVADGSRIGPEWQVETPSSGSTDSRLMHAYWVVDGSELSQTYNYTLLLAASPEYLSGDGIHFYLGGGGYMMIEDMGPVPADDYGANWHRGYAPPPSGGGSDPDPPTPPKKKKKYKRTFHRQWHKTWQQNGAAPSAAQDYAMQGRTPYYTAAGIYRSQVGFNSMTGYLSGAEILKVRVRLRVDHTHSSSGGTVVIGTHYNTVRPKNYVNNSHNVVRAKFRRGQTRWITLPKSTHSGFKSGSRRGISFYVNSTNTKYYVQIPAGTVRVEITYKK